MADPDLQELLTQTVTIEHLAGKDPFTGDPTYGPPIVYATRITPNRGNEMVRTPQGDLVIYRAFFTLAGDVAVSNADRVTLPDGQQPPILAVGKIADDEGAIHRTKAWLG